MAQSRPDPRTNAYTPQLADIRLRDVVAAAEFVEGVPKRVRAAATPMRVRPDPDAPYGSELLVGEAIRVFTDSGDGWSWCQNETDSYVGFVQTGAVGDLGLSPTHRVTALRTFIYPAPDIRLPPTAALSLGARLTLGAEVETRGTPFYRLAGRSEAVVARHVAPVDGPRPTDYVAVAERFLNVPYLWGGRTSLGLDCSALVQLALWETGAAAPRDSDMQREQVGRPVGDEALRRGDLVFWRGHVAILAAADRIVHASGHHMAVVSEPLAAAVARIGATGGPPLMWRRP